MVCFKTSYIVPAVTCIKKNLDKKPKKVKGKKKVVAARAQTGASVLISNVRNNYTNSATATHLL